MNWVNARNRTLSAKEGEGQATRAVRRTHLGEGEARYHICAMVKMERSVVSASNLAAHGDRLTRGIALTHSRIDRPSLARIEGAGEHPNTLARTTYLGALRIHLRR